MKSHCIPVRALIVAVLAMLSIAPTEVRARGGNRVRLDLSLSLFRVGYEVDLAEEGSENVGFSSGPLASNLGLGIGASLHDSISVGCRLLIGIHKNAGGLASNSDFFFAYGVMPFFEYAFKTGRVRPFLHLSAGVGGLVDHYDLNYEAKRARVQFVGGFGGGIHIFFGPRVSLDWWLLERIGIGKERRTLGTEYDVEYTHTELTPFTADTDLFVGLTAWI